MARRYRRQRTSLIVGSIFSIVLLTVTLLVALQTQTVQYFLPRASNEPANIMIDASVTQGELQRPWRNLAQGGEASEWRLQPIHSQVAELHPEYIRIDHIYDFYDIVSGSPGNLQFNFDKLDLILNDIQAVGAIPYIALSYTPPVISSGSIVDEPQNYADWQTVVQRTIQHVSGTRGTANVYYEVWNEPDLFGGWKYYGDKNYLTLYEYAARGASQASGTQPFKIGGPATTALYKNWINALLNFTSSKNLRIDFISWHRYDYDLDQYRTDMRDIRSWIRNHPEYAKSLEFHITEWGHDSENNDGYDSILGAAHTVAGSIEMMGVIERAFVFEIQDGKDPNGQAAWGRWGLFQHSDFGSKAKPRFYGLQLLDSLQGQKLQLLGKGSFVKAVATKAPTGEIQVMLVNYDPSWKNVESVPIKISSLTDGVYEITEQRLSGATQKKQVTTTSRTLNTTVFLDKNEVVKLTIRQL